MNNTRKWSLYLVYTAVVTLVLLYYLFPSDSVKAYVAFNLQKASPDLALAIDAVKPVFPPAIRLHAMSLSYGEATLLDVEEATVAPKLLSLLRQKKAFSFGGEIGEGDFGGSIEISRGASSPQTRIDAELTGIRVDDIAGIQEMFGREISGQLNASILYEREGTKEKADVKLTLTDGVIKLTSPIFALNDIAFRSLEADATLDGRKLQIKKCTIKGQQIDGNILGSIRLRSPLGASQIDLRGTLKPQRALLSVLRRSKLLSRNNNLPLTLTGTVENPSFSLQ